MGQMVIHHQHLPGTVNSGEQKDVVSALKHSTFTWGKRHKKVNK